MNLLSKIIEKGIRESATIAMRNYLSRPYQKFVHRNATEYAGPTDVELLEIETALAKNDIALRPLLLSVGEFESFVNKYHFPPDYHGGRASGVWDEKLLEHFIAYQLCGLASFSPADIYLDVAASSSPWTKILREQGISAYSVDLELHPEFEHLDYYLETDAKSMPFDDSAVSACSLQCAFEMFGGNDDWLFLKECKRVLKPGGIVVISPLYMHTHHCGYSTPDYYEKGYADEGAVQYINSEYWGIPFSRKYSPELLKSRILDYAEKLGLTGEILVLKNKNDLGRGIYCHFILTFTKPEDQQ